MSETRNLTLHPKAIYMFIRAQAGSLGKALSEAVMNSLDAGATKIDITLSQTGFTVTDNGTGIKSKAEIEAWFETLGFPHDEENHRVYGKFGLGRAQMWAYARTKWYSNEYIMNVDIPSKGLNYELQLNGAPLKGTRIEGEFFEPLALAQMLSTQIELKALLRYSPHTVTLDNEVINQSVEASKWDFETPEAYFKLDAKAPHLSVYNKGILVSQFPKYRFHTTGVIVSKKALELNIARNEILVQACPVWKRIIASLPQEKKVVKEKKRKPTEQELAAVGKEVLEGKTSLERALDLYPEMLTSVYGRCVPLFKLAMFYGKKTPVVFVPKGDAFGKTLAKLNIAEVLDIRVLERFGFDCVEAFKRFILEQPITSAWTTGRTYTRVWSDCPKKIFGKLEKGFQIYPKNEFTAEQKAVIESWERPILVFKRQIEEFVCDDNRAEVSKLSVALGESPEQCSWYEPSSFTLVLNSKTACTKMRKSAPELMQYVLEQALVLLTAYHKNETEAKDSFVRVCTSSTAVGELVSDLLRRYANACIRHKVSVSQGTISALNELKVGT